MSDAERVKKLFSSIGILLQILGATVFLAILGHFAIGGIKFAHNLVTTGETDKVDVRYESPVYDNYPDKIEYWREFNKAWTTHFEPYFHWRRDAFAGKFINVDEHGIRRTVKPGGGASAHKVFVLGGSTTWGTGVADDKTIPSILQSMLGESYDVYNFGESAYVSAQELNYLIFQLNLGNIPDSVIFYDGVNDGYAGAYSPAIPRDPHNLRMNREQRGNAFMRLYDESNYSWLEARLSELFIRLTKGADSEGAQQSAWEQGIASSMQKNSLGVVDAYEAHIRQVGALAKEYGFKAFFFWQPNIFSLGRRHLNPYETRMLDQSSPVLIESQRRVYLAAKERFSNREAEGVHFLGDLFDDVEEPIYIDWHHVGPNGNEIVAKEMLRRIGGALGPPGA